MILCLRIIILLQWWYRWSLSSSEGGGWCWWRCISTGSLVCLYTLFFNDFQQNLQRRERRARMSSKVKGRKILQTWGINRWWWVRLGENYTQRTTEKPLHPLIPLCSLGREREMLHFLLFYFDVSRQTPDVHVSLIFLQVNSLCLSMYFLLDSLFHGYATYTQNKNYHHHNHNTLFFLVFCSSSLYSLSLLWSSLSLSLSVFVSPWLLHEYV